MFSVVLSYKAYAKMFSRQYVSKNGIKTQNYSWLTEDDNETIEI